MFTFPVGVMGGGGVLTIASGSTTNDSNATLTHSSLIPLGATKAMLVYSDAGNGNKATAVIIDVSGDTLIVGTPVVFNAFSSSGVSGVMLTSTTVFVVWNGSIVKGGCILTVSGSTISVGTVTTTDAPQTLGGSEYALCAITATTVLIGWYQASGSNYSVMAATIAGGVVTFGGTTVNGTETCTSNIYPSFVALTATTALFSWFNLDSGILVVKSVVVTCASGTTIAFGTPVIVDSSIINGAFPFAVAPISSTAALIVYGITASVGKAKVISISGTTVTANSAVTISAAYGFNYGIGQLSSSAYACGYTNSTGTTTYAQIINVAGTVPSAPAGNLVTLDSDGDSPDMNVAILSGTKILFGYESPSIAADTRFKLGNYS